MSFGPASSGVLALNGFNVTIGGLATDENPGLPVARNGSASTPATLTLNNTADKLFAGSLQDGSDAPLSLIKSGPGTQTFSGSNFYTGSTTITAGTLSMAGGLLASNVLNQSNFSYSGGTFGGRLINAGPSRSMPILPPATASRTTAASRFLGRTITVNGNGLDNEGTLTLAGGTLASANSARISIAALSISLLSSRSIWVLPD